MRSSGEKIVAFKGGNFERAEREVEVKGLSDFSIWGGNYGKEEEEGEKEEKQAQKQKSKEPYKLATFVAAKGGGQARVDVFEWDSLQKAKSSISFSRGQDASFDWNGSGSCVVVKVSSQVDQSNSQYYGNVDLYLLRVPGFSSPIQPGKPIHDACWHKNGKKFVVVYGAPPATTCTFNLSGESVSNFGRSYVNNCKFSPDGKLLSLAGFGTFKGNITLWDEKQVREVACVDDFTASLLEWSPDCRFFLTATLARMQDNHCKLWHYDGTLVFSEKLEAISLAFFKKEPPSLFPSRPISPRVYEKAKNAKTTSSSQQTKQRYVPPQMRGSNSNSVSAMLNQLRDIDDTPSFPPTVSFSQGKFANPKESSHKLKELPFGFDPAGGESNKKKKKKKKKAKEASSNESNPTTTNPITTNPITTNPTNSNLTNNSTSFNDNKESSDAPSSLPTTCVTQEEEERKKIYLKLKKINKKLKDISKLKEQQSKGMQLEQTQLNKVFSEEELLREKLQLESSLPQKK